MIDVGRAEPAQALALLARQLFAARVPLSAVREMAGTSPGYSTALWSEMARLDWLGLDLPAGCDGVDAGLSTMLALYEEFGRGLVAGPHLESSVVAAHALLVAGDTDRVRAIVGGRVVVPALIDPDGTAEPASGAVVARSAGEGYELVGTKVLVPYADSADELLVPAVLPGGSTSLFAVPGDGVVGRRMPMPNTAGLPLFAVRFDGCAATEIAGARDRVAEVLAPGLERAQVLRGAQIVGAGEWMLATATDYASARSQFGQPIGRYQAVQYLCSDMAIDIHLLRLLCAAAAWQIDREGSAPWRVAHVQAHATRAAQSIAHRAHEVLAGVGFMEEADLHLFTRFAKHWELDLGGADEHDERIVRCMEVAS